MNGQAESPATTPVPGDPLAESRTALEKAYSDYQHTRRTGNLPEIDRAWRHVVALCVLEQKQREAS